MDACPERRCLTSCPRVDRRKRLSHVWGRRFRLPTSSFAATRNAALPPDRGLLPAAPGGSSPLTRRPRPRLPCRFPQHQLVAEPLPGCEPGLPGVHARWPVLPRLHLEMKPHLLFHIAVEPPAPQPEQQLAP